MKQLSVFLLLTILFFSCRKESRLVCPKKYRGKKVHSFKAKNHRFRQAYVYTTLQKPDTTVQLVGNLDEYIKMLQEDYKGYLSYNEEANIKENFHSIILKDYLDTVLYLARQKDTLNIDFRKDFFERRNNHYGVSGYGTIGKEEHALLHQSLTSGKLAILYNYQPYTGKILWRRECTMGYNNRWWGEVYYLGNLELNFFSNAVGWVHIRWRE